VTATAITMPATPMVLPRREETGEESPFSARMKQTAATR
jgi:hypothetical protein